MKCKDCKENKTINHNIKCEYCGQLTCYRKIVEHFNEECETKKKGDLEKRCHHQLMTK